jgi:hypothetical protein
MHEMSVCVHISNYKKGVKCNELEEFTSLTIDFEKGL